MPTVSWRLLDREAEIDVTHRQLPHWDQAGALTFVTFRLADSMPVSVLKLWDLEQQDWLARQGFPHLSIDDAFQTGALPEEIRRRFLKYRQSKWHDHLDMCLGSCVLSDPELATIVAGSLRQFDGERYDLERFVVMPNHVHLLVQMRAGFAIRTQCEGWLRYTARAINRVIGRRGVLAKRAV